VSKTIFREKAKKFLVEYDWLLFMQKRGELIDPAFEVKIPHEYQVEQRHFITELAKIKKSKAEPPKVILDQVEKEPTIEYSNNTVKCAFEVACYLVALSYKVR
jgi:hypothetical protein